MVRKGGFTYIIWCFESLQWICYSEYEWTTYYVTASGSYRTWCIESVHESFEWSMRKDSKLLFHWCNIQITGKQLCWVARDKHFICWLHKMKMIFLLSINEWVWDGFLDFTRHCCLKKVVENSESAFCDNFMMERYHISVNGFSLFDSLNILDDEWFE